MEGVLFDSILLIGLKLRKHVQNIKFRVVLCGYMKGCKGHMYHDKKKQSLSYVINGETATDHEGILITRRITDEFWKSQGLKRVFTLKDIWNLGVGTVFFSLFTWWNHGLGYAGAFGMLAAIVLVAFFYIVYSIILAELSILFPYAGGPYSYVRGALGRLPGFIAGISMVIQYICMMALILHVFDSYLTTIMNQENAHLVKTGLTIVLIAAQTMDVRITNALQFVVTSCAISMVVLFFLGSAEGLTKEYIALGPAFYNGWRGFVQAIPFAIWVFMGLEGMSFSAEEVKNERFLTGGIISGVVSVAVFVLLIWYFSVGSIPWQLLTNKQFPLLYVITSVQGDDMVLLTTFSILSISVFVASLNGLLYGASRQVYSLSRAGYIPFFFSKLFENGRTPGRSLFLVLLLVYFVSFGNMENIAAFAVLSALISLALVIISYGRIRNSELDLLRAFRIVNYKLLVAFMLSIILFLAASILYSYYPYLWKIEILWFLLLLYYYLWAGKNIRYDAPEEFRAVSMETKSRLEVK